MEHELKIWVVGVLVAAFALGVSIPVFGHHGIAGSYDESETVTLTGKVTEWRFANPHVHLFVDVTDEEGRVLNWTVEGSSVYYWSRAGWNRGSLRPGMEVTLTVFPAKDGGPLGIISKIALPDGRELAMEAGS